MQIGNTVLTEDHKGSKVTYVPRHARDDSSQWEGGTISSWNDTYVFVNYDKGTYAATRPEDLLWS